MKFYNVDIREIEVGNDEWNAKLNVELGNIDKDEVLDEIGIEYVKEYFGLVEEE